MKSIFIFLVISIGITACSSEDTENNTEVSSVNMFGDFFYNYDTIPTIYVYRDIVGGLEEQFHRIFSIEDTEGKHIVVEIYSDDGRILEALNYNLDSLNLMDHMVVDTALVKRKAELFKNQMIPLDKTSRAEFASRFAGILDSTLFLKEVSRKYSKEMKLDVMGKKIDAVVFSDDLRLTLFNPITRMEDVREGRSFSYFAKGFGLVEWHTENKKGHFRLEKIITQDEFVNLMSKP